jgi:hypothetical protein
LFSSYVLLLLKVPARWEISPQSEEKRVTLGFKSRNGKENGSCIYQLLLHNMCLLPSNIPANNCVPQQVINQNATFKDLNRIVGVDALAGVDVGKGKKCVLASFDSDNGRVGMSKKLHLVTYESDANIEMADDMSA